MQPIFTTVAFCGKFYLACNGHVLWEHGSFATRMDAARYRMEFVQVPRKIEA